MILDPTPIFNLPGESKRRTPSGGDSTGATRPRTDSLIADARSLPFPFMKRIGPKPCHWQSLGPERPSRVQALHTVQTADHTGLIAAPFLNTLLQLSLFSQKVTPSDPDRIGCFWFITENQSRSLRAWDCRIQLPSVSIENEDHSHAGWRTPKKSDMECWGAGKVPSSEGVLFRGCRKSA